MKMNYRKKGVFFLVLVSISLLMVSCGRSSKNTRQIDYLPASRIKDGRIGLIDVKGQWVLENAFSSNSNVVCTDGVITELISNGLTGRSVRYHILKDKTLTPLLDKRFSGGSPFFDGYATVTDSEGKLKLIDKEGKETDIQNVEGYQIVLAGVVSEGLIRAKASTGKWGYLNTKGSWVIQPRYELAESFTDGTARVKDTAGILHVIDPDGKILFKGIEESNYSPAIDGKILSLRYEDYEKRKIELLSFDGKSKALDVNSLSSNLTPKGNVINMNEDAKYGITDNSGNTVGELFPRFESAPMELEEGFVGSDKSSLLFFDSKGKNIKAIPGLIEPTLFQNTILANVKDQQNEYQLISPQGNPIGSGSYFVTYTNLINDFSEFKKGYSVQSTWMDFDKILDEALRGIGPAGIQDLTKNTSVESAVEKLSKLNTNNNQQPIDAYDNYTKSIYSGVEDPNPYDEEIPDEEYVGVIPSESEPTDDRYPMIDPYSTSYSSMYVNGTHCYYSITAGYNSYLKIEKYGFETDPVFKTEYYKFQGYQLNPSAQINYVEINVNVITSTTERFQEKLAEYLKKQGWNLIRMGSFKHPGSGNEIEFTPSGIKYIFP